MEDILKEIDCLSARLQDNLETKSVTNSADDSMTVGRFVLGGDAEMRMQSQKKRRRRKGRKRRMEDYIELEQSQSTSTGNTSDELILQDYVANIALNASDSDLEIDKFYGQQKPPALLNNNILRFEGMKLAASPLDMAESDSFSETLMVGKSLRRRRRSKRSNRDDVLKTVLSDHLSGDVFMDHSRDKRRRKRERVRSVVPMTHNGDGSLEMIVDSNRCGLGTKKSERVLNSDEVESGLSDFGVDADDEAEESCIESCVDKVITWWDDDQPLASIDKKFDDILSGSFPLLTLESQKSLQLSIGKDATFKLNDRFGGVFKTNKLVEEFLSRSDQTKLFITISEKAEQDQILQLAALYALQCHTEHVNGSRRMILIKTRCTSYPDRGALLNFVRRQKKSKFSRSRSCIGNTWDSKRQKISHVEDTGSVFPLPDANKGSQMLRGMGWIPGTGLGKDNGGRVDPVKAVQRPRRLGLGFDMDMS